MSESNGEERRTMNQDQINRDRLLSEVHSDVKHILKWSEDHTKEDAERFDSIDKRIKWAEKILYGALGVFLFVEFLVKFSK